MTRYFIGLYLTLAAVANLQAASPIVIIHGAWGGAHHWKDVANAMTRDHDRFVRRVSLTGLGERSHLASREIGLQTHIQDVVNAIEFDDLDSVVLIAHSYGGAVASGVVNAIPERIAKVIYLDAHLLDDGEAYLTHHAELREKLVDRANADGDGWLIPVDWANPMRDTPHPLATLLDPIQLKNPQNHQRLQHHQRLQRHQRFQSLQVPATYWLFTDGKEAEADDRYLYYQRAQQRGWPVKAFPWNHNPHRSRPDEVVAAIIETIQTPQDE